MKVPKIAINGFGRIGRLTLRALLSMEKKIDIIAINDIASNDSLAYLFEFDSIHGKFQGTVEVTPDKLIFNGDEFIALSMKDPGKLPWKELDVDIVIESTGKFRTREFLQKHLNAGAKKVILSAPGKTPQDVDVTIVRGVNNNDYNPDKHNIISNASCTTNALATTVKVLDDNFNFINGSMTTVHSYTNDQRVLDSFHKDYRRMRAAALNMFPTTTGASKAIGLVLPHLKGKIDGLAIRVPTPNVSIVDLNARVEKATTVNEVREVFTDASNTYMKGILAVESRSLVSTDFNGNPHSGIIDIPTLKVIDNHMIKVLVFYDNEIAYVHRLAELVHEIFDKGI